MRHLSNFLHKTLTSRKFWAAVASSIPFAMAEDWQSFAMVWMAYAGIQGAVDGLEVMGSKRASLFVTETAAPEPPSKVDTEDGEAA